MRELPVGEDRAQIRAFSLWQVQHDLARRERVGRATGRSADNSLRLPRAAAELWTWAMAHGLTLAKLRPEHLDDWLEEGSSTTTNIRPFLRWAARGGLTAPLDAGRRPAWVPSSRSSTSSG